MNTKSISILKSLNNQTFKKSNEFFKSEFFNMYQSSRDLHKIMTSVYPTFHKLPKKENIYQTLFGSPFNAKKWHLTMSRYNKSLEQFLVQIQLQKQPLIQEKLIFQQLIQIGKESIISEKKKALEKLYSKVQFSTSQRLHSTIELEELSFEFYSRLQKPESISNLQVLSNHIDHHFLYLKLKYSCELLTRKNVFAQEFDFSLLKPVIEYAKVHITEKQPTIYAYLNLLLLIQNGAEKDYKFLREFIFNRINEFSKRDLRDMNVFLLNFCIKMINIGKPGYLQEVQDLYKDLLHHDIITEGEYLHLFDFKNISTVAIRLGDFEWLKFFTQKYLSFIAPQFRNIAEAYNLSRVAFLQENYNSALNHLSNIPYPDIYYELDCRILVIKIFFEKEDFELFDANCNSLKILVQRSKLISEYQKRTYINFIKWATRIFKSRDKGGKVPQKWQTDFREVKELADRSWINEKMENFK